MVVLLAAAAVGHAAARPREKKVVFIAGKKSHGPGDHEYEKGLKLFAECLRTSPNLKGFRSEVHLDGWPRDPHVLDDADTIVLYCDGSDHSEKDHPLLEGDRLEQLGRAMARGAGLVALHYTVFVPMRRGGPEFLEWLGGFFDYETGPGANHWYSRIQNAKTIPYPATPEHPIARGLKPFPLKEEYYYRMRFAENDARRVPILNTSLPNEPDHETVAWAVERKDGGRGFAYTGGHYHANWDVEPLRKMVLNAIVWTAKGEVPKGGVDSYLPAEADAGGINTLVVTGRQHPAHDWRATTPALQQVIGRDRRFRFRTLEDPELLAQEDLSQVRLIVLNYNNWESATLGAGARARLLEYVRGGGGLAVIHFANGAWLDWPDYRRLARRVWIEGTSSHDAHGPFQVRITDAAHPITRGMPDFGTTDELYCRQVGDLPIRVLATAHSKVSDRDEPMAFVYEEGKGRVFQTVLGHDAAAIRAPGPAELIRRGAAWAAGEEPADLPPPPQAAALAPGRAGMALNARIARAELATKPPLGPPFTADCWARLDGKSSFNILIASDPKESVEHWELYTTAGTGTLAAYLPGWEPSVQDSGVSLCDGQWHHLALIFRGEPEGRTFQPVVELLVDGKSVKVTKLAAKAGRSVPGPLWVGAYPPGGLGCDGLIDRVRLSRGINRTDGPAAPPGSTVAAWSFDAATGTVTPDEEGRYHATLVSTAPAYEEPRQWTPLGKFPEVDPAASEDWASVNHDAGGTRYSPLDQINRDNVSQLQVAWTYNTGEGIPPFTPPGKDAPGGARTIECTPIVVDGVMYLTTATVKVAALDAATGREIWKYDPQAGGVNRGVAYWSDGRKDGARRILVGTADGRLLSLDARTGRPDRAFGEGGTLNLRKGIERDISKYAYGVTSAPAVFENLVYVGYLVSEGQPGAPGDIRAFDVRTGREAWRFHTVPRPGEFGNDTWEGESWKERSGANAWPGFNIDAKRGILFCGTGSAASDFWGGDRIGANLFANCTLALDARTGRRLWHFQTVHHDIWDHDNPTPPVCVTVRHRGRKIDAVAQVTKTGYCFLFDRVTGKPLFDVREVPAPASDVPGEVAYPTQPVPEKPPAFSRNTFTDADVTDRTPEAAAAIRERLKGLRYGPPHTPPSERGSVIMPGFHGGATWSGASFDPTTGLLYVNSNDVPYVSVLKKSADGAYVFAGYTYFRDPDGYPANKPPWGRLTALDLNRGEIAWQIPFGEYPELRDKGVPVTGCESFGGTIVTAGGLVFIAGTRDEKLHAFDKATGKLLWETQLPAGGYATPCTYSVNGRQYVVIAAGGGGKIGTRSGNSFVAFALPGGTFAPLRH